MVFPYTDYYVVATRDGYYRYTSLTLTVEEGTGQVGFPPPPYNHRQPAPGVERIAGANRVDSPGNCPGSLPRQSGQRDRTLQTKRR